MAYNRRPIQRILEYIWDKARDTLSKMFIILDEELIKVKTEIDDNETNITTNTTNISTLLASGITNTEQAVREYQFTADNELDALNDYRE